MMVWFRWFYFSIGCILRFQPLIFRGVCDRPFPGCIFFSSRQFLMWQNAESTNDYCQCLVFWGPVFWIPRIPLWKGLLLSGTLRIPKKQTAPKGINLNCQCWAGRGQWLWRGEENGSNWNLSKLSNEKRATWFVRGFVGDEILSSYMGRIKNYYPY